MVEQELDYSRTGREILLEAFMIQIAWAYEHTVIYYFIGTQGGMCKSISHIQHATRTTHTGCYMNPKSKQQNIVFNICYPTPC